MKFTASTSTILKQIQMLNGVIPNNPTMPILENFLFEIQGGLLKITASDMQTTIISEVNVEANADGNVAIPAKMLTDTLKNLPEQPVTFSIDFETYTIEISSDNGRYKLAGENAEDYPANPDFDMSNSLSMTSEVLGDAIGFTLFATSNDDMKPNMNGVFFNLSEEHSDFVATDSHRLVRYRRHDIAVNGMMSPIIMGKKALTQLKNILPSESSNVTLEFNEQYAIFTFGSMKLIARLIDERFPDYENVIPLNNTNLVTLDRQALLGCLKRIVIYANKTTNQVRFKVQDNELFVSAEDLDFSNEAKERLFCEHDGEDLEIGFNAKFLIEILNNISSDRITLRLSEPGMAGLIVPEEQPENEDVLMLVMPIMLHNFSY
ncbi:DNA polymerase III subunit beta [Flammeovirga kamogawensis]|uniref:Beta sliding clamp n=1 Tax=Flammeovirga kamogawensis TaxID=373891 RepID=A0ABX8GXR3_9BACT|nr:DNA polymerase III subunit beta [Flammeovirga kamogawensis]MBB6460534.1 DNA polymerase-3 subunit beta [Flammeovirga kamogawensis]QWG07897.1 DNA polymerase III subunit beta [Flammeovirga kamogawensis]TRX69703.1 DNA polymerase III subunit beta [Flammeovirga kamogawensis]